MTKRDEASKILTRLDRRKARVINDRNANNAGNVAQLRQEVQRLRQLVLDLCRLNALSMRTEAADLTDDDNGTDA
jgi:hypothetical protein